MTSASGNSASKGRKSTRKGASKSTKRTSTGTRSRKRSSARKNVDSAVKNEVILIAIFAVAIFMFLCVMGLGGSMSAGIRNIMFGIFVSWTRFTSLLCRYSRYCARVRAYA